jgi:hypothetical protein
VEVASAGAMATELDPGAVATIAIFPQNEFGVGCRCADSSCCRRAATPLQRIKRPREPA